MPGGGILDIWPKKPTNKCFYILYLSFFPDDVNSSNLGPACIFPPVTSHKNYAFVCIGSRVGIDHRGKTYTLGANNHSGLSYHSPLSSSRLERQRPERGVGAERTPSLRTAKNEHWRTFRFVKMKHVYQDETEYLFQNVKNKNSRNLFFKSFFKTYFLHNLFSLNVVFLAHK